MAEYPRLELVKHLGECYIELRSLHMSTSRMEFSRDGIRLHLRSLDFWKVFLSMLQEVSGDNIAFHMPSHGLGREELDVDMAEAIIDNLIRIENELKDLLDSENSLVMQALRRRLAEKRGLPTGA